VKKNANDRALKSTMQVITRIINRKRSLAWHFRVSSMHWCLIAPIPGKWNVVCLDCYCTCKAQQLLTTQTWTGKHLFDAMNANKIGATRFFATFLLVMNAVNSFLSLLACLFLCKFCAATLHDPWWMYSFGASFVLILSSFFQPSAYFHVILTTFYRERN